MEKPIGLEDVLKYLKEGGFNWDQWDLTEKINSPVMQGTFKTAFEELERGNPQPALAILEDELEDADSLASFEVSEDPFESDGMSVDEQMAKKKRGAEWVEKIKGLIQFLKSYRPQK